VTKKPKLREKLQLMGVQNLNDDELLSLVLGTGSNKIPVNKLGKKILNLFPIKKIHLNSTKDLIKQGGIGLAKASRIMAAIELGRRNAFPTIDKVTSPTSVLPYLRKIRDKKKEYAMCLYLNARSEIVHTEIVALGGLNYIFLEPRNILSPALTLPATSIILAHNHPSENTKPSLADKKTTKKLIQATKLLDIELLDHLIITKQAYFSFKEAGLLDS
jgi:DNA repair protein RadC